MRKERLLMSPVDTITRIETSKSGARTPEGARNGESDMLILLKLNQRRVN